MKIEKIKVYVVKFGQILGWKLVESKSQPGHELTDCKAGIITPEMLSVFMI